MLLLTHNKNQLNNWRKLKMITTRKLKNGITLNVQSIKGAKTISCFFAFNVGSFHENRCNYGISHLLEHMLFCGTKNRNGNKIKEDFNNCGTIFNGSASVNYTRYYIKNIGSILIALSKLWRIY